MLGQFSLAPFRPTCLFIAALLLSSIAVAQSTEQTLYTFSRQGSFQASKLTYGPSGRLFGTVYNGGTGHCGGGCGFVFELSPSAGGGWNYHTIFEFDGADGQGPLGNLIFDAAGNLYGTTDWGGDWGNVYKLTPSSGGSWTETVLYTFTGFADGSNPQAGVVMDAAGNLYGTTLFGGDNQVGCVYKVSPNSDGTWTETNLFSFDGVQYKSGSSAELVLDATGNLYGTTNGGTRSLGMVFELSPNSDGTWTESVIHNFVPPGGEVVLTPLWMDSAGNLYGTTDTDSAPNGAGTVFELSRNSDGSWTYRYIYEFSGKPDDGSIPDSGLTPDSSGNLYGTTYQGGAFNAGTVYRLRPGSDGKWTETVIYSFTGRADGGTPDSGAIPVQGHLYGATESGGSGGGVVYDITP
jgi:uncharacterized repeat protein (TIGR03803 family)